MKTLFKGKWVEIVKLDGYEIMHESQFVHVLPYIIKDDKTKLYGIRLENCPPYYIKDNTKQRYYTVLSGKIEKGETSKDAALRELREEAGVTEAIIQESIYENIPACKSTSMRIYGYTVECATPSEYPKGDGSINEEMSETLWLTVKQIGEIIASKPHDLLIRYFFERIKLMETSITEIGESLLESLRVTQEQVTINIDSAITEATQSLQVELDEAAATIQSLSEQLLKVTEERGNEIDNLIAENQVLEVEAQKKGAKLYVYETLDTDLHLRQYSDTLLECANIEEVEKLINVYGNVGVKKSIFEEADITGYPKGKVMSILEEVDNKVDKVKSDQQKMAGIKKKEKR